MATSILSTGSTAATSADVELDSFTIVRLKGEVDGARVVIELKDESGGYHPVGELTQMQPGGMLPAATYRFVRIAGATCGVFSG
jgi:hypothetical protein